MNEISIVNFEWNSEKIENKLIGFAQTKDLGFLRSVC